MKNTFCKTIIKKHSPRVYQQWAGFYFGYWIKNYNRYGDRIRMSRAIVAANMNEAIKIANEWLIKNQ